jgi:Ras family protein A
MSYETRKVVIVGDGAVGKTCILSKKVEGEVPSVYVPTIFENSVVDMLVDNKYVQVSLWDTAGQEEYNRLRPLSYPDTDIVFITYSIDNPDSLENISEWYREIKHYCNYAEIVLVGNKLDLRNNKWVIQDLAKIHKSPVTIEEGQRMARNIGACLFAEVSAINGTGIEELFEDAIRISLENPRNKRQKRKWCGLF